MRRPAKRYAGVEVGAGFAVLTEESIRSADIKGLATGLARSRPGRIFRL